MTCPMTVPCKTGWGLCAASVRCSAEISDAVVPRPMINDNEDVGANMFGSVASGLTTQDKQTDNL